MEDANRLLAEAAAALKVPPAELPARIAALAEDRRRLERQVSDLQKKLATGSAAAAIEDIAGIPFTGRNVGEVAAKELKPLAGTILKQMGRGIVALAATAEGKASLIVAISPDLTATHNAVTLVRAGATALGGTGGGGKPDLAQAGGPDGDKADAALAAIKAALGGDGCFGGGWLGRKQGPPAAGAGRPRTPSIGSGVAALARA